MQPYRVLIAEDHVLIRQMIRNTLEKLPSIQVVGEVADGLELLEHLERSTPDMILLDITMPGMQGLAVLPIVKRRFPPVKVLILTMHKSNQHIACAFEAGADGYLLKENTLTELVSAIEKIRHGESYVSDLVLTRVAEMLRQKHSPVETESSKALTNREREILQHVLEGKSSKEIAQLLSVSIITVYNYRSSIKNKLGIRTNIDLFKYGIKHGYIQSDQ
ncbi:MAG: response regulator transcription factor [Syntrophobacteraceae bacterium]|jgi:DNA-binding NarL/FixJ family response regulator